MSLYCIVLSLEDSLNVCKHEGLNLWDLIVGRFVSTFPLLTSTSYNWNLELLLFGRLVPCFMRKAPITAFRVERRPSSEAEAKMLSGVRTWAAECSKYGWWRCYMMGCHCCVPCWGAICRVPWLGRPLFIWFKTPRLSKIGYNYCFWWLKSNNHLGCKITLVNTGISYLSLNGLAGFLAINSSVSHDPPVLYIPSGRLFYFHQQ